MRKIQDLSLKDKKILVRVDFNVPCDHDQITDDTRIQAVLPTIRYVLDHGGTPILLSHRGRPKGKFDASLSLAPCAQRLQKLLGSPVLFGSDCIGEEAIQKVSQLKKGEILLLENLRFHEAEEKPEKDPSFAAQLAALGECYINEAFATSHRPHSSMVPITNYFSKNCVGAGLLLQKEVEFLGGIFKNPQRPLVAIIGGAKISTKIKAIESLLPHLDSLLIGGGMAFTFLKAQGVEIGKSLCEPDKVSTAAEIIEKCRTKKIKLLLPIDHLIVNSLNDPEVNTISGDIPQEKMGVDIGPKTSALYEEVIMSAGTIFWNGPMGVFENPLFAGGTQALAETLAKSGAVTVVGGGETVDAIHRLGLEKNFTHISTGGGASLEFIEQMTLPAIAELE